MKRAILGALFGIVAAASAATAQQFTPSKQVDIVVHTGAGGGNDAFIRAVLIALKKDNLAIPNFVVLNKTGGGSTSAMAYLREKAGDSHTIAVYSSVWVTDGLVQEAAPLTVDKLAPISALVLEPAVVVVRAESPYKTLKDFIDAAKANPGKLKQSGGSITARDAVIRHVLMDNTKADWSYISFPSGGERIASVLGGHVDMMMIEPSEAGELIRSGKLRAIAQIADQKIEGFPDVPTLKEAGYAIPNVPQSRGILGPPDMPAAAVAYYADLFKRAAASPSYKEYLKSTQLENAYLGPAETGKFLATYQDQLRTILKGAGVKVVR